jgi:hypothetical protein
MRRNYFILNRISSVDDDRFAILLVFFIGCIVRLLPELFAYPNPIGYDVVNYYIPITTNYANHWHQISSEFPLYVSILHSVHVITGINAYLVVVGLAIAIFGFFTVSIFLIARKMLKTDIKFALFITIFVIFQMAVLRTTWDLHRDVLAISMMLCVFVLINKGSERRRIRELDWKSVFLAMVMCALIVTTARIIGSLFVISLIIYSTINRTKFAILCAIIAFSFFATELYVSYYISDARILGSLASNNSQVDHSSYNPKNLMYLFIVVDGLLIPTGVLGFNKMPNSTLLKIPLLTSGTASFSWLLLPAEESLVADRWIILLGILLSIFAAYGLYDLGLKLKIRAINQIPNLPNRVARRLPVILVAVVLGVFIMMGISYEIMSNGQSPYTLWYGLAQTYVGHFVPSSMQFNSVQASDTNKLTSAVAWINKNTPQKSVILGEKHWRGFMEMYLQDHRTFYFSENLTLLKYKLVRQQPNVPLYFIHYTGETSKSANIYTNNLFSVDRIN